MPLTPDTSRSSRAARTLAVLAAGLAVYLLMNHLMLGVVSEHFLERGVPKSLVYVAWMTCGYLLFFGVVVTSSRAVLAALLVLFAFSVATNYTYAAIFTEARPGAPPQHLTPEVMEWMVHELGQAPLAWAEFKSEMIRGLVEAPAVLALFLGVRLLVRRHRDFAGSFLARARTRQAAVALFLGFQGLAVLLQPSYSMAETNTFVFGIPGLLSGAPGPAEPPVRPAGPVQVRKILLVVDESVTFDAYRHVVAASLDGLPALDFGEATSAANCSASSNALLRWGLERSSLGKAGYDPRTNPTIWGFARAAGLRTVLIDGQSKGAAQNFVSAKELELVDEFAPADVGMETDDRLASALNARLRTGDAEFLYVIKRGAHFPYEADYPPGAVPAGAPKAARHAAAVAYSTSGFFRALLQDVDLSTVLLVYTSDHGQALDGRSTHCSASPRADEFSVPLVVLTGLPELRARLAAGGDGMRDRASHLQVFPSLLLAMGYAREWVEAHYGPTLAGPPGPRLRLASGLPFPTRRRPVVEFSEVPAPLPHGLGPPPARPDRRDAAARGGPGGG